MDKSDTLYKGGKMIFKKLLYLYHKKNRYIDSYFQDLISEATRFIPYDIDLRIASKNGKENVFNHFEFTYQGIDYILQDDKLELTYFE